MNRIASLLLLLSVSFQDNGLAASSLTTTPTPGPSLSPVATAQIPTNSSALTLEQAAAKAFANKEYSKVIELLSPNGGSDLKSGAIRNGEPNPKNGSTAPTGGGLKDLSASELVLLGKSYEFKMNIVAALGVYQVGSPRFPENSELKTNLGKLTWQSGFLMEADLYLAKNADYQKKIKAKENEGIEILRQVITTDKSYQPAYILLGQIYETKSNWLEMQDIYLDMAKVFGDTPEISEKLCTVSVAYSSFELANKYCALCLQLNAKSDKCAVALGQVKINTGVTEEGKALLKTAADRFPESEPAQMAFADFSKQDKKNSEALKYYERALTINPKSKLALAGAGDSAFELQDFERSLKWTEQLCKMDYPSISLLRRSVSTLKAAHNQLWLKKYEDAVDSCRSKNTKAND